MTAPLNELRNWYSLSCHCNLQNNSFPLFYNKKQEYKNETSTQSDCIRKKLRT
jgi:hypothetical protein